MPATAVVALATDATPDPEPPVIPAAARRAARERGGIGDAKCAAQQLEADVGSRGQQAARAERRLRLGKREVPVAPERQIDVDLVAGELRVGEVAALGRKGPVGGVAHAGATGLLDVITALPLP